MTAGLPRDPVAELRAAADRITRSHARPGSVPLEFQVPALPDRVVHRAGPDVALIDQAAFQSHALTLPPAGWTSGWVAHSDTLAGLTSADPPSWTPPGMGMITDLPVWHADHAPAGVLVPVYVRLGEVQ